MHSELWCSPDSPLDGLEVGFRAPCCCEVGMMGKENATTLPQLTLEEIFSQFPRTQHPQPYFPRKRRVDQLTVTKQQALLRGSSTSHWNVGMVGIRYPRGFGQKQSPTILLHMSGTF